MFLAFIFPPASASVLSFMDDDIMCKYSEQKSVSMNKTDKKPELLAPAGSLESFFAAMEKGADAVYAGLREFSARARAKNFTLPQIEKMLAYAHAHGRRIYVTLNTLVKDRELPQLVETLAALAGMRVDGVIVQDLAVARLVRNHFPSIPLHASTQMTIHNTPGVRILEELGFRRVVLARELAVDEVAAIAAATPLEIEIFVHGALCFSISGQCFFSSYLGGHSGNRGRCAQPCRRLYSHRGKQGYFFSTSDLSAIDLLPEIIDAGVASLKIEGRMKSAEYVAGVVQAYRLALDAPERSRKEALAEAKELLKYSFGRTPTRGFLASQQPDDIANPWQKGGTGRFVGLIKGVRGNRLSFETRDALYVGDRLRAQPKSDMAGQAWTVRELYHNRKKVMEVRAGSLAEVETPFRFEPGDAVYKVSSRDSFTISENACLRRLDAVGMEKLPCGLRLSLVPSTTAIETGNAADGGKPLNGTGHTLLITAEVAGSRFEMAFTMGELEPARTADMRQVLQAQFAKTGEAPFRLESLEAPDFPSVLIPAATFREIRAGLYAELSARVSLNTLRESVAAAKTAALRDVMRPREEVIHQSGGRETLYVIMDNARDWRFPLQSGADRTILPLHRAAIHQLPSVVPRMRGSEERIIWQLPFIIFDRDIPLYRDTVRQLHGAGFRLFETANLSHFALLKKLEGIHVSTWHRCFTLNSQALLSWMELGAESVTLYIEDDADNLEDLLTARVNIERRVIVHAPLPVMTTKVRMKDVRSNIPLQSDRGEEYCVITRDGLQTIIASQPFSLAGRRNELRRKGCVSYLIDLRQTKREAWADIMAAFRAGRSIPGTTEFNYSGGLV